MGRGNLPLTYSKEAVLMRRRWNYQRCAGNWFVAQSLRRQREQYFKDCAKLLAEQLRQMMREPDVAFIKGKKKNVCGGVKDG